jgi:hypothetical protein
VTADEVYVRLKEAGLLNAGLRSGDHRFIASGSQAVMSDLATRLLGRAFTHIEQRPWLQESARP